MVTKILSLVMAVLLGPSSQTPGQPGLLAQISMRTIRRVLLMLTVAIASIVVFTAGVLTLILDLVLTSRDAGQVALSPVSWVGGGLVVVCLVALAFVFQKSAWRMPLFEPAAPQVSPVSEAVAELLQDFVAERRESREMQRADAARASARESREPNRDPFAGASTPTDTNPYASDVGIRAHVG